MADDLTRVIVTIPNDSAIPEDASVNVWHFDGDDGNAQASYDSAIQTMLTTFYQAIDGVILSPHSNSPATCRIYNMRDALPRVPRFTFPITLTLAAGGVPNELAVCLSYQAAKVSGLPQARRRGRIFLGPINSGIFSEITGETNIVASARTAITNAAAVMQAGVALATVGSEKWSVYSPTTDAASNIDDAYNDVTDGWVDNAFDVQRRRGLKPNVRTLF